MTIDITYVTWKWAALKGTRRFASEHVNVLRAMLARHSPFAHRLVCITDDPAGLDATVEPFPMPHTGLEHVVPHTQRHDNKEWPSCYRRLWLFSEKARELGNRLFSLDIDCIVTGDLTPLVAVQGNFVGWCHPRFETGKIAGGAYMLTPGTHLDVWTDFDPETSPLHAAQAGHKGSDQAWMSHRLYPPDGQWTERDGLVKLGWIRTKPRQGPGQGIRIIFTSGLNPPWSKQVQRRYPWVKNYWKL